MWISSFGALAMNGDNQDWRFKGFGPSQLGKANVPGSMSPASVVSGGHVGDTWKDTPVTGASRVMPGPSGTNWNSTPSSVQTSDFRPPTSGPNSWIKGDGTTPGHYGINDAMFRSASNQSQPDASSFYKDRTANIDLSSRDHQLYGAGSDLGFTS